MIRIIDHDDTSHALHAIFAIVLKIKMKIELKHSLKEIKTEFSKLFEGLKIEFYKKAHNNAEGSSNTLILDDDLTIEELTSKLSSFEIPVEGKMMVSEVETLFKQKGLNIQVFRRVGDVWIQTTSTDSYSLNKQKSLSNL